MADQKQPSKFSRAAQAMMEELRKDTPNILFLPIDKDESDRFLEQLNARRAQYPILKPTDESLGLFKLRMELHSALGRLTHELDFLPVTAAIQNWLGLRDLDTFHLSETTKIRYAAYMMDLIKRKVIPSTFSGGQEFSVGGLRHIEPKSIMRYIESFSDLSEDAKNARIDCYLSFTAFLERETFGWFKRALPISSKKFSTYRSSLKTSFKALSLEEWRTFTVLLAKTNHRDYLIALTMFYGTLRISDALSLTIDRLDFQKNIIRFPLKKNNLIIEKPVSFPVALMKELNTHITSTQDQRKGSPYLFITRNGKRLTRSRINYSFAHTSKEAKIKQVSPDTIRATWLALKQSNLTDEELNNFLNPNEVTLEK